MATTKVKILYIIDHAMNFFYRIKNIINCDSPIRCKNYEIKSFHSLVFLPDTILKDPNEEIICKWEKFIFYCFKDDFYKIIYSIMSTYHNDTIQLFLQNVNKVEKITYNTLMDYIEKKGETSSYPVSYMFGIIDNGFAWSDTPEGHDYWSKLNSSFTKVYNLKFNELLNTFNFD